MLNSDELLADCIRFAKEAGIIQLEYFRSDKLDIQAKFNESDVVTAADKASEKHIISRILQKYPTHAILSEESGASKNNDEYRWVIDPLDGTTNFSSGIPEFCVSIGIEHRGETIIGVVFAPYLGELFHAKKGGGAFLNGKPIKTGSGFDLHKSVVTTGFPVDKDRSNDNNLDNVAKILPLVRGLRRLGSAAVDISYVAAGYLDAYWELNLHEWDVCAALLIAEEAGAKFDFFRKDRNISVLVSKPGIFEEMLDLLSKEPNSKPF